MKWRQWFTTPAPRTAWALAGDTAAVVHNDRKRGPLCAGIALEPGVLEVGAVGLQGVDRERLAPVLANLQARVDGARRASVVIPAGWVRGHLLELEEVPRKRSELDEIARWRLKKLLPVRPEELRIDLVPAGERRGRQLVLCVAGLERAFAELEAAFAEAGVQPAVLTSRLFALAAGLPPEAARAMVIHLDPAMLSTLVLVGGRVRLLRTKQLPAGAEPAEIVARELAITLVYLRERLGIEGELAVLAAVEGGVAPEALKDWLAGQEGLRPLSPPPTPGCQPPPGVDPALLPPAFALTRGGSA